MARLKLLHGDDDSGVILARHALADEVARDLEPPLQDFDLLAALARLHGHGRDGRPAALRDDRLVSLDCGLGRLDIARGERRRSERRIGDEQGLVAAGKLRGMRRRHGVGPVALPFLIGPASAEEGKQSGPAGLLRRLELLLLLLLLLLLILAGQPGERAGVGRNEACCKQHDSESRSRGDRSAPLALSLQHSPLPVACGFIPLEYKRFCPDTLARTPSPKRHIPLTPERSEAPAVDKSRVP